MRPNSFKLLTFCLAGLVFFQSCKKNEEQLPPANNNTYNPGNNNNNNTIIYSKTGLNVLFAGLRSTPQTFTVNAGTYATKIGAEGTVLKFYPNSFKTQNGTIINSGTISIKLVEMYSPGAMIANRATTISNGQLLNSGGQVKLTATMNGQTVYANRYGIKFAQPSFSVQPMALYYGNNSNVDSLVTWTIGDTTGIGTTTNVTTSDTNSSSFFYTFDSCTNFNWINCDYFSNYNTAVTNVSLVMPDTSFNTSNTQTFLVFTTLNSVTSLGQYTGNTFSLYTNYYVPVGLNVHLVAVTNKNGNYYYFEQLNTNVTNNMSVNATMAPQTLSYVLTHLSNL